jgi:FtsH-binding integral membrane protein
MRNKIIFTLACVAILGSIYFWAAEPQQENAAWALVFVAVILLSTAVEKAYLRLKKR